ncbi:hypothetical protein CMI37_24665 [Candidatus Pacearchaeota archaeon]|nr:hypothetical protein [Candidatus Pacearchaeota archaeon]|tara:strand:+ start:7575 stop:8183 length:609 start_codon:yes stop_codon:yes gene_type:complete
MDSNVLTFEDTEAQEVIDKYLTEDDKVAIFKRLRANKIRCMHNGDWFLLHSTANKVKTFIEDGHYASLLAYGLDYMIDEGPSRFTSSNVQCSSDLLSAVHEFCFDWYQESGEIEEELLDRIYAWTLISPYTAMSMTERTREELHRVVDILWMCPATGNRAFAEHCYQTGRLEINSAIQHWMDVVPIMRKGCGYANIIQPQEC